MDSLIYLDFLSKLKNKIDKDNKNNNREIVYIMDNAQIHKNTIMKGFYKETKMKVIMTAPFCSELHFIEHVFNRIKRKGQQIYLISNKFAY